jgi:hypothetical protein
MLCVEICIHVYSLCVFSCCSIVCQQKMTCERRKAVAHMAACSGHHLQISDITVCLYHCIRQFILIVIFPLCTHTKEIPLRRSADTALQFVEPIDNPSD